MLKIVIAAGFLTLMTGAVDAQSVSPANTGHLSSSDVGTSPIVGQNGPNFVSAAADVNQYQIKAAQLAIYRAQRDDVKAYAKRVLADAETSQKSLLASLHNEQRTIHTPSTSLSTNRAALISLLQKAPKGSFDNLYLTQGAQVQQAAWAVYKGYAQDGTDPALQQVAGTGVPKLEDELSSGKALLPSGLAGNQ